MKGLAFRKVSLNNILVDPTGLTAIEIEVYDVVCKGNIDAAVDISKALDVSDKTVRRALVKLTQLGYIEGVGGNKGGTWVPVSKSE
ncbi:MAG: HTH domain-containing protein [Candidatus Methanoplasma sp.]|nr:HTH domain-containing protein [Candidatus Methanoplasma sp.]